MKGLMAASLTSTPNYIFSWREQTLIFLPSQNDDTLLFDYINQSAENSASSSYSESSNVKSGGLGSRNLNATINGDTVSGGPFSPSQIIVLQQQIAILRCIETKVPIPSELLISLGKLPLPKRSSTISSELLASKTSAAGFFQLGFMRYPDPEPGRCRRTDGKKWRCSRVAVANHKYCDKHINRGRHRSRKLVEGHNSHASRLEPTAAPSSSASSVSASENLQLMISSFSSAQMTRMLVNENINDHMDNYQDLSLQYPDMNSSDTLIPISTEPTQSASSLSLPPLPDSFLASDSFLEHDSFLSCEIQSEVPNVLNKSSFDVGSSKGQGSNEMSLDPIAWAAYNGGPLGEVLANQMI
ncbi:uncharacterized protein A4U43_C03F7760 [Asparagus officinalis]|uniref:Growth-regulating factor n=1 Tax=Asparagus officinalis TaxID=4686 RepID=A0A5P1FAY7_ASPOF|nr:growth-regulating factor 7-like [Asparagus officinalis]ONK74567.1 uncharacterized protein A4U43_C03F7760 [Asparagus officinalis]